MHWSGVRSPPKEKPCHLLIDQETYAVTEVIVADHDSRPDLRPLADCWIAVACGNFVDGSNGESV